MTLSEIKSEVMDEMAIERALTRIAHEILERNRGCQELVLIGIRTRGIHLARRLAAKLHAIEGEVVPLGVIDVTLYRDDLRRRADHPRVERTEIPFPLTDKRVILVDDSIVRGTTSMKIVEMVRNAGAREVHMRISCPPTTHSCYYGVDTPDKADLIAAQMTVSTRGVLALRVSIIGRSPFLNPAARGNVGGDTEGGGERGSTRGNCQCGDRASVYFAPLPALGNNVSSKLGARSW